MRKLEREYDLYGLQEVPSSEHSLCQAPTRGEIEHSLHASYQQKFSCKS